MRRAISAGHLNYLPCSMTGPNSGNRCANAEDANWAAPFPFGRWAWDRYLFGAPLSAPGLSLIDATYNYGFARPAGKLPANTFGGYPTQYYSTAYNAGYGEWGLASKNYRDQGILSYRFMIANAQRTVLVAGEPALPNPGSPWTGTRPENGNGSSPRSPLISSPARCCSSCRGSWQHRPCQRGHGQREDGHDYRGGHGRYRDRPADVLSWQWPKAETRSRTGWPVRRLGG